jgi:hypothetical protein
LSTGDEAAFQSLAGMVQIDLADVPLDEALEELSRLAGIQFHIDVKGLADRGVNPDHPVSVAAPQALSLGEVLAEMLPEELGYFLEAGQLVVTSIDRAEAQLRPRLYHLSENELAAVEGLLQDYWSQAGGPGEITPLGAGWVLITADVMRHAQIGHREAIH